MAATTEAPKTEAPKTEAPKTEAPKTEAPKTEAPKTEAPKTEAPKTEEKKPDGSILGVKPGEEKKTEEVKTEEKKTGAPEKYTDFTLPEGFKSDAKVMDAFRTVAKELNLSQDAAQKLVDLQTNQAKAHEQAILDGYKGQQDEWAKASKALYGADFEKMTGFASVALDRFGGSELRQLLDDAGLGNHPMFVKMFVDMGKAISEDKPVDGGKGSTTDKRSDADVLYPNMGKKK